MRSVDLEPHVSLSVCTENKASWVASWASAPAPGGLALTGASVAKSPVIMERGWWVCLVPWSRLRSRHPRCPPRWLSRDRAPLPTCTPRLAARAECGGRSERVGKRAGVALHGPRGGSGLAPGQAGPEPRRRRAASQGSRWARPLPHVGGHGLLWTAPLRGRWGRSFRLRLWSGCQSLGSCHVWSRGTLWFRAGPLGWHLHTGSISCSLRSGGLEDRPLR